MTLPRINQKCTLLLLVLLFTGSGVHTNAQQSSAHSDPEVKFLDLKVPEFQLHNQTLIDGLWMLAKAPAPFAFGFEGVLKKNLAGPDILDPRFSLQLKNKTVRQVLDALCEADPRFRWSMDGAVVNVFPRAIASDNSYLLNRKLPRLELKDATDVQHGLLAIVRQIPPPREQIANAQLGGGDPYPSQPWTVTYYNLTVRQVINRLALRGGPCGTWIFGGSVDFRSFGFFNTYLRCSTQPSPKPQETIEPDSNGPQHIASPGPSR